MSYGLSPSIEINEKDFLSGRRQTANRFAGTVGNFNWGPVGEKQFIRDEKDLVEVFHDPDDNNFADWFSVFNFNAYNDKLYVVRAIKDDGSDNAGIVITKTGTNAPFADLKKHEDDEISVTFGADDKFKFLARYCGEFGNSISVAMATATDFPIATTYVIDEVGNQIAFRDIFEYAPQVGEVALVVLLNERVVERHIVSLTAGSKNFRGESNYIETYVNRRSKYIYAFNNTSQVDFSSFESTDFELRTDRIYHNTGVEFEKVSYLRFHMPFLV